MLFCYLVLYVFLLNQSLYTDATALFKNIGKHVRNPLKRFFDQTPTRPKNDGIPSEDKKSTAKEVVEEYQLTREEKDARTLRPLKLGDTKNDPENDPWGLVGGKRHFFPNATKPEPSPIPIPIPKERVETKKDILGVPRPKIQSSSKILRRKRPF